MRVSLPEVAYLLFQTKRYQVSGVWKHWGRGESRFLVWRQGLIELRLISNHGGASSSFCSFFLSVFVMVWAHTADDLMTKSNIYLHIFCTGKLSSNCPSFHAGAASFWWQDEVLSCGVAQTTMAPLFPSWHLVYSGSVLFLKHPSTPSKKLLACGMFTRPSKFYLKFLWTTNLLDWLYHSN